MKIDVIKRKAAEYFTSKRRESIMRIVFMAFACFCVLCVALICLFLFANGLPAIGKIGPLKMLLGTQWRPSKGLYGIAPMILGSIYVTIGAIIVGVPLGVLTSVYMARYAGKKVHAILHHGVSLMAGIPSIVFGFFGLVVIAPIMHELFGGTGKSMLTASVLLGIMILPTIISVSETAIKAVPESMYEGALGLGATHEQAVFFVILPAARQGVASGVVLGIGRAIGETMAVIMIAGNQTMIPDSLFHGLRTLTANIVLEMGYASDLHREALIGTAVVLFVFILLINLLFSLVKKR